MRHKNDPADPSVNAVKIGKSLKSVEMMSLECIMVVFDGFYSLELIYLVNYAQISHFSCFPYILYRKLVKITFCLLPTCSIPHRKLKFAREVYFTIRMISWNFCVWYIFRNWMGKRSVLARSVYLCGCMNPWGVLRSQK